MPTYSSKQITGLLCAWSDERCEAAFDTLVPLVYDELHRQAHCFLRRERAGHTLQTTALINEAFLKIIEQRNVSWESRTHFFGVAAYRRALVLNPNLDEPHQHLGKIYLHIGLFEEALTEFRKSLELNPGNTMARYRIGIVLIHQGKYEEALRSLKSTPPDINPAIVGRDTAWLLISLGRREEAAELLAELIEKNPIDEGGQFASFKALLSALAGNAEQAEREIRDALEKGKGFGHFHHTTYIIACSYAALNQPEEAVRFLQMAAEDGYPCYPLFERDAHLDAIRQNPKFKSFLSVQKQEWEYYKSLPQL